MAFSLRVEHRLIFYENIEPVFGRLPSISCPPREDPRLCKGVAFSGIASPGPISIQIQSIYAENHKKKEGSPRRGLLPIAVGETERSDDEPTECPMPKGTRPRRERPSKSRQTQVDIHHRHAHAKNTCPSTEVRWRGRRRMRATEGGRAIVDGSYRN